MYKPNVDMLELVDRLLTAHYGSPHSLFIRWYLLTYGPSTTKEMYEKYEKFIAMYNLRAIKRGRKQIKPLDRGEFSRYLCRLRKLGVVDRVKRPDRKNIWMMKNPFSPHWLRPKVNANIAYAKNRKRAAPILKSGKPIFVNDFVVKDFDLEFLKWVDGHGTEAL